MPRPKAASDPQLATDRSSSPPTEFRDRMLSSLTEEDYYRRTTYGASRSTPAGPHAAAVHIDISDLNGEGDTPSIPLSLKKCKRTIIAPYSCLLTFIGWKPWFHESLSRRSSFWKYFNCVYPVVVLALIVSNYVFQVLNCQGKFNIHRDVESEHIRQCVRKGMVTEEDKTGLNGQVSGIRPPSSAHSPGGEHEGQLHLGPDDVRLPRQIRHGHRGGPLQAHGDRLLRAHRAHLHSAQLHALPRLRLRLLSLQARGMRAALFAHGKSFPATQFHSKPTKFSDPQLKVFFLLCCTFLATLPSRIGDTLQFHIPPNQIRIFRYGIQIRFPGDQIRGDGPTALCECCRGHQLLRPVRNPHPLHKRHLPEAAREIF
ncbi:hypothetical protein CEXT_430801 [Caerostris extrusa]|uniref:Uncharacterized protein n=1 Tax=Caerostris extrusa TaxID=172846 RepID=A0AAV4SCW9_CAEEX|nr:hypothetical protein CEXT_430801 [Caerostris extrusa]